MKKVLLILFFMFGYASYAQQAIYTDNDGDGIIEYVLKDKNGKVLETGYYYNKKMVGTWTSYFPNGKKQTVAKFKNGVRHGNWSMYDETGKLLFNVMFKEGKKVSASQHSYATNN